METLYERDLRIHKEQMHRKKVLSSIRREESKPNRRGSGKDRGTRRNHPMRLRPFSHAGCE